jgi:leucyl aminopeptidase
MHFDMTGYAYRNEPTIWLMKDNVDSALTNFTAKLITTYTKKPVKYTRCGYACSDHASWYEQGYATVLPAESRFEDTNPVMHSSQDTIDKLSITHMTDYAKIATAFVVELAEPSA